MGDLFLFISGRILQRISKNRYNPERHLQRPKQRPHRQMELPRHFTESLCILLESRYATCTARDFEARQKEMVWKLLLVFFFILKSSLVFGFSNAKQAVLIDADTGHVLYEKNADELTAPSSMSKMMTIYLIFEKNSK